MNKVGFYTGLPDGFFSDQNSQFEYILEDLGLEIGIFYDHWVYLMGIW
jgi:hypothetical protein